MNRSEPMKRSPSSRHSESILSACGGRVESVSEPDFEDIFVEQVSAAKRKAKARRA